jgi:hypothetical protein
MIYLNDVETVILTDSYHFGLFCSPILICEVNLADWCVSTFNQLLHQGNPEFSARTGILRWNFCIN